MEYIKISYKDEKYPQKLLKIPNYPKELYILGNYALLNKDPTVAIIGSRDCTEYGRKYAHTFAKELSQKDICIVSGLAIGIDEVAHTGAVENKREEASTNSIPNKTNGYFTKSYQTMVV